MADMVCGSVLRMSRFGKGRDFAGCSSWSLITPLFFVSVERRIAPPALSTVCESEAAKKSAIAITNSAGIVFLVKSGKRKDIKGSLVLVAGRLVAAIAIRSFVTKSEANAHPLLDDRADQGCTLWALALSKFREEPN
jgi:hypothetical protein